MLQFFCVWRWTKEPYGSLVEVQTWILLIQPDEGGGGNSSWKIGKITESTRFNHWLANLTPFSIEDLSSGFNASKPSFSKSESGPKSRTSSTPFFPNLTWYIIKSSHSSTESWDHRMYIASLMLSFEYYLWGKERKLSDCGLHVWALYNIWNTVESFQACISE